MTRSFWKKYTDKVGVVGSIFAALCCLGFPALLSILSAIGLGFLINDAVLLPLLIIFLLMTLIGLVLGMREHHRASAFVIGIISAAGVFIFIFIAFNKVLATISCYRPGCCEHSECAAAAAQLREGLRLRVCQSSYWRVGETSACPELVESEPTKSAQLR
jgi:mercuric ion transport protein